jgi:hypothetical protein
VPHAANHAVDEHNRIVARLAEGAHGALGGIAAEQTLPGMPNHCIRVEAWSGRIA